MADSSFAGRLLAWFDKHGRTTLPWQHPRSAYRVWLSEVMLQQTQVATVIPYFLRFVEKFPDLQSLANAELDDVVAVWAGLGYYSRARNLHRSARICMEQFDGDLPRKIEALNALPGIGRSTAGAILAQAHGTRVPILDANVKRVLTRFHAIRGWYGSAVVEKELWEKAEMHTPHSRLADYTQAIMDLGASVCVTPRPLCAMCPLNADCTAYAQHLTALLPERKAKRPVPTRATIMLILRDSQGRVLLQRRPPTGVWAGMWSLPEAMDADAALADAAQFRSAANDAIAFDALTPFVHTFTHYRLSVTPLALRVDTQPRVADVPDRRWLNPDEATALGLPAPVRRLIASLSKEI